MAIELTDDELRIMASKVKARLIAKFGEARVNTFFNSAPNLSFALLYETFLVVREKLDESN